MCIPNDTVKIQNGSKDQQHETYYSLDDIKQHNTPTDAWASVHGKVVNITEFAKRHPGGDIILLVAGKDATVMVETYHPRGIPKAMLEKLEVGTLKDAPPSYYNWDSDFYSVLKQRVLKRLDDKNLKRRGSYEIWIKAVIILSAFWFSLYKMITRTAETEFREACMWTVFMGIMAHFVGSCIQHDGNHGAFSESSFINTWAGWTMDMIGASGFIWQIQHMLGHHPYTNLLDETAEENKEKGIDTPLEELNQESDPDVFSSFPFMRMHPLHTPRWFHRYQHLYAPILFALMTLTKVFQQDIQVATQKRLYHIDAHCRFDCIWNQIRFWAMKVVSTGYMIVLPCYFHGFARGMFLFTLGHLVCGEMLANIFLVNHVIEGVAFAKKKDGEEVTSQHRPKTVDGTTPMEASMMEAQKKNDSVQKIPLNDWAAVQCQTSVNWSPGSWIWNHFSGGLSHQIEHHLFPSLCHTTYCHINDVVEKTCHEYGVPYQSEPSLFAAYFKMMKHLKDMGREKQL